MKGWLRFNHKGGSHEDFTLADRRGRVDWRLCGATDAQPDQRRSNTPTVVLVTTATVTPDCFDLRSERDPANATTLAPDSTPTAPLSASLSTPAAPTIQEYDVPPGSHPHDVAPAPDGTVWYTAQTAGALGRLDPKTGKTHHIALGSGSAPHGVIVGPDGAALDHGRRLERHRAC